MLTFFFGLKICFDVIRFDSNKHGRVATKAANKLADPLRINFNGIWETTHNQKFTATRQLLNQGNRKLCIFCVLFERVLSLIDF